MKQHYNTTKVDIVLFSLVSDLKVVGSGSIPVGYILKVSK